MAEIANNKAILTKHLASSMTESSSHSLDGVSHSHLFIRVGWVPIDFFRQIWTFNSSLSPVRLILTVADYGFVLPGRAARYKASGLKRREENEGKELGTQLILGYSMGRIRRNDDLAMG